MDLFDLVAKITLDTSGYERSLNDAEGKTTSFGNLLKKGFATAGKLAVAGISAAGTAAVAVSKQALEAYANYEQLVGGVETLFGTGGRSIEEYAKSLGTTVDGIKGMYEAHMSAQNMVLKNAQNAWKTAGLSANEYMETVTAFSASLLQSVGGDTEVAANIADMAITDMADNANKMGTSMEAIQNAYQGFAKQNYTMLDNLKLGYGGTKTEMERLLQDATAISGVEYDIDSLSDVYEAIHVIQGELDITGTTAKEASTTISGSVASMKSAWQNLLVGIADDNADFETLVGNFVDSVVTTGQNIIPRVESILGGLGKLIQEGADKLVPIVVDTIIISLPQIVESGISLVVTLISGLISAIPQLVRSIPQIVMAIVNGFVAAWPQLKQAGRDVLNMVGEGIKSLASAAWSWGRDMIQNFIDGITAKFRALRDKVANVAQTVKNFLGFSEPKDGPLSNFHTYAPDMMELFAKGIRDNEHLITDQIGKSFDFGGNISNIGLAGRGPAGNTSNSFGAVSINVYPSAGMDEKALAKLVSAELQRDYRRKVASLA